MLCNKKYSTIKVSLREKVALITLNRPQVLNALNKQMRSELLMVLEEIEKDERISVVVLTGKGRGFCSGGDILEMEERTKHTKSASAHKSWVNQSLTYKLIDKLYHFSKPTIAAVNGPAAGVGCDLMLCCDFIFADDSAAHFTMAFISLGLIPDAGLFFLPRRIGISKAKELVLTGRRIHTQEALEIGLIDFEEKQDSLMSNAFKLANDIASKPKIATFFSKEILNQSLEFRAKELFSISRKTQAICLSDSMHHRLVDNFLQKIKTNKKI